MPQIDRQPEPPAGQEKQPIRAPQYNVHWCKKCKQATFGKRCQICGRGR